MAYTNLYDLYYCKLTESTDAYGNVTETLADAGALLGKGVKCDENIKTSDADMYASGALAETVREFESGTLGIESDDIPDAVEGDLLGASVIDGEIVSNESDVAPFCRVGGVHEKRKNNVKYFVGTVRMKCKFSIPNDSAETKGKTTSLKSKALNADLYRNVDGDWRKRKTFTTLSAAKAYVFGLLNIPVPTVTVGSLTGGSLQVGAVSTGRSYTVTTDNIVDGATVRIRWYTTSGKAAYSPAPAGISIAGSAVSGDSSTLTVTASSSAMVAGSYYFTVTIANVESSVVTLTVAAAA